MQTFTLVVVLAPMLTGRGSLGLCPADPSKGEVKVNARGSVPFLLLARGRCSCPNSYWLCYLKDGRQCGAASCQFIGSGRFAQIYGLQSGAAYTYAVAGTCGAERDEDVKALLCNAGSGFIGRFQLPATVPTAPPRNITAVPRSHRELEVCWTEPTETEQNGQPTGYTIRCTRGCPNTLYSAGGKDTCTTISGLTPLSSVTVQVRMHNEAGAGPYSPAVSAVLKVKTPGNPPRHLQPLSSLGRSVDLLWYGPVNDSLLSGPVTSYVVQVTTVATGKTEHHTAPQTVDSQSGSSMRFTVDGLKPVTEYALSVAAVNAFGVGVFTAAVMATTAEAAPDGPPSSVEAKPFSNSVITVTCHPPTPELANGIITGYTVEYCVCGMDQCSEPARVTMAAGMNSVSLQGLQEQTMYCVRAAAHTSQGTGPWSGWVTVLTNLAAPPPPREVGVFNVSFSTTTVCWKAPTQNSVREFVLKYGPTHKTLSMSNQSLVVPFLSGQQLYCSKLSGLEENTRYRVLVVAANSVGKSEPVRLRFRTAIHAPTGAPTNVTVDCQTHAVVVTWCVPEKEDRNGQITGFKVELHCPGQPTQWRQVTRAKQCVTTTFEELLAGKTYRVRVKAFNAAGEGPFSEFLPARTKEAVPGQPSVRINPQTVQEHSAFIIYSSPNQPNGDILHYMLTATPSPASCHAQQQHKLPTMTRRVGLFAMYGLLPGMEYRVCVTAVNGAGVGEPACSTLHTKGVTPPCATASRPVSTTAKPSRPPTATTPPSTVTTPPPSTVTSPPSTVTTPPSTVTTPPPSTVTTPPPSTETTPPSTVTTPPPSTETTPPPSTVTTPPPSTVTTLLPPTSSTSPPPTSTTPLLPTTTTPSLPNSTTPSSPNSTTPPLTTSITPAPPASTTSPPPTSTTLAPPTMTSPGPVANVCKDDGRVKVTLRVIGSVGVLVRWQGQCPSSTLRFSDVSTHGAETSVTLGSKTSLFFMSRAQLTAGRDYQVCVDVLCGDVTCSGCSTVNIG